MKNKTYNLIFLLSVLLFGCRNHAKYKTLVNADDYSLIKQPEQCFTATFEKDSAFFKYKTLPNGKIRGMLTIKYAEPEPLAVEKNFYHGEIKGRFTNDTLFADYIFANGKKMGIYRNPLAFLKKDNKLVLGFGAYVNYLGKTWLMNHQAINFNKGRFQFMPAKCNL